MRDLIRQIVSGYKSLKLEGQDGSYVVFRGQDPDNRDSVHIKILPRLLEQDPELGRRFEGLARTIRQLNHPNVLSVRRVGQEAGLPYIVTRALEKAQPLATRLDQPWAIDAAADLVMQAGQALEHAYNKGLVHGSLTPDNIVVEGDDRVLVSDFGLDELLSLVGGRPTATDSPYLAPERSAGGAADARADVYSLAAILYRMLTGRPPQVVKGQVLPPSRFNSDTPEAMDRVIVRALSPDPAGRYPDVKAFLVALGKVKLGASPEKTAPPAFTGRCPRCGAGEQTGRFCRKCGLKLPQAAPGSPAQASSLERSVLDEPIQITHIDVGYVEVGEGVNLQNTDIAQPMQVAQGEVSDLFPEPLEMPRLSIDEMWPHMDKQPLVAMPEPPPMPVIDWAEIAPPMPEVPTIEDIPLSEEEG